MKYSLEYLKQISDRRINKPKACFLAPPTFITDYFNDGRKCDWADPYDDRVKVADELGYISVSGLTSPKLEDAAKYDPIVKWEVEEWTDKDHRVVKKSIETPEGSLWYQDRWPLKDESGAHHVLPKHDKKIIQSPEDVKPFKWYICKCAQVLLENRERVIADIVSLCKDENEKWADRTISMWHFWMPHDHVLFSHLEQDDAIIFMYEHNKIAHEMLEVVKEVNRLWMDAGIAAKFQTFQTAIWGYEIFSPDLHQEFVFDYAKEFCDRAREADLISWVHCCGKLKGVIENGFYQKMGVDILECLNYSPCGDVDDWRTSRALLGDEIITKGNIDDGLLLTGPVDEIQRKTKELLDEQAGFRHLFSSANGFFPDTPVENVRAMMDVINNY